MKGLLLSVIIALSSLPTNLGPFHLTLEGQTPVLEMLYASPLRLDAEGKLAPYVARLVSLRGKRAVLKVVSGFFWENGRPITSEDLAFTYNFLSSYQRNPFYPYWRGIQAKVEGGKVIVRFPARPEKYHFLFPVLPENFRPNSGLPISGPYRPVRILPGIIVLEKRKKFPLRTAFGRIKLIEVKDPAVMKMKLEAGEADIGVGSPFYLPSKGFRIYRIRRPFFVYLGFRNIPKNGRCWIAHRVENLDFSSLTRGFSRPLISPFQLWFPYKGRVQCRGRQPGKKLELLVPSVGRERLMVAQLLQQVLGGIRILPLERGIFLRRLRSGNFHLVLSAFSLDFPSDLREILSCNGAANYFGYCSREMEKALEERDWKRAHRIFLKELPFLPLYQSQYPIAVKKGINWRPFTLSFSSASPFRSIVE